MGLRRRYLPWLVCTAVAAVGIPAFAYGDPASRGSDSQAPGFIDAVDFEFVNPATPGSDVTIDAGETVTFGYPSGSSFHNVRFSGASPTSCTQTAGSGSGGPVPPLPAVPQGVGWSGKCTFNASGTYAFYCEAHDSMTGEVHVLPVGNPTPTPTPSPTPTPTPTPTPARTGVAAGQLKLTRHQRGQAVRGSIAVARAGSRLSVKLLAKPSALNRRGRAQVGVGGVTRTANAGPATFSVTLSRAARKALARRGRLALTVRIAVTPPNGTPFRAMKTVTLKR